MNLFIQEAAEQDILNEVEHYAELHIPHIGLRFQSSALTAIDALPANPLAGLQKASKTPKLAGSRSWPVKGFKQFRIDHLTETDLLTVVRIQHAKHDISRILEGKRSRKTLHQSSKTQSHLTKPGTNFLSPL